MLLNLALDFLGTAVTCDKVSSDSYECTNLITTDFMTRRRGYLSEHFIKPPVHLTFTFPCNFNISHIILDPYVGQQQTLQIDLLCASKPRPKTSHGKLKQQLKASNSHQSLPSDESHLPAFHQVSRVNNCTRSRVCFYSSRYQQRASTADKYREYQIKSEMRHSRAELLNCASHIMIKIVRTQMGSTPAVSNIEIWGSISSSVCTEVRKSLEEKYICFVTPAKTSSDSKTEQNGTIQTSSSSSSSSCSSEKRTNLSSDGGDGIEIPEEFLDPLTCEMMTIPMILPCGKNVDKSSLDRFSDWESSHGRHPRDPFTGIEFSLSIKPIPNGDLKARIDSFLLSYSNIKSVATIPRTVSAGKSSCLLGKRKMDDTVRHVSSLVAGTVDKTNKCSKNSEDNCLNSPDNSRTVTTSVKSSPCNTVKDKLPPVLNHSDHVQDSPSTSNLSHHLSLPKNDLPNSKSHDACLKDSLDSALSSILASFSAVKNAGQPTVSSADRNLCLKCGVGLAGSENTVYKTPCSHFICRGCLLSYRDQEIKCLKCNTNFKKIDVVRSH